MSGNTINAGDHRMILAIDFGTTCSSIGYVYTSESGKIIKTWPDSHLTAEWVPTTIKYDEDNSSYRWGYQIDEADLKHEWFKLGLYPELTETGLAKKYPSRTALPPVTGSDCEQLVTDYLKALKKHAEKYITNKFGTEFLKNKRPEYIITVPAVWSEKAQETTRSCAEKAGMQVTGTSSRIQIITEPEAAGIYALKNMKLGLNAHDTFVLCDAGGGTVDLISYTVAELGDRPLIFESAPGSGGLCGSTFLNRIFDVFLREKFANYSKWDDGYHQDAMDKFENKIKREFNGDQTKSFFVPARGLPNNTNLNIKTGQVEISGRRLSKIFEPVIIEVLSLVVAQIQATSDHRKVNAVLLAGGFGRSKYLMNRIKKEVGDIRVVQIEDGETAIVRGALIRGLAEKSPGLASVRVGSRRARKHFGTLAYVAYDPFIHDISRREEDKLTGGYRVKTMRWFVEKGAPVQESKPASFEFYWDQRVTEGRPTVIEMTLYACEDLEDKGAPTYVDDPEVKKLVELKADVLSIPVGEFNQEEGTRPGEMYYKLNFEIEMTCRSGSLEFGIVYNGKKYSTVRQKFV